MEDYEIEVKEVKSPYDSIPSPFCYPGCTLYKYQDDIKFVAENILPKQLNNIGNHSHEKDGEGGFDKPHDIERNAIKWCCQLLDGDPDKIDGHFTTGGTESNIEAMWIARKYLESKEDSDIMLILSPTAHYSFLKAADILKINYIKKTKINSDFTIDLKSLEEIITTSDTTNIIIVATAANFCAGTIDPISKINDLIKKYEKNYNFYFHVDAAYGSFIIPFMTKTNLTTGSCEFGFTNNKINSITLDGHKIGNMPYPAGIILTKEGMKQFIQTNIQYLGGHTDGTLCGSRNAFPAIFANYMFKKYGFDEYAKQGKNLIRARDRLQKLISEKNIPGVKILPTSPYTNFLPLQINVKDEIIQNHPKLKNYELRFASFNGNEFNPVGDNFINVCKICVMNHNIPFFKIFVEDLNEVMKELYKIDVENEDISGTEVTPWTVEGDIKYDHLIKQFGTEYIDNFTKNRFNEVINQELHPWIKRDIFFSHRALLPFLNFHDEKKPCFLYTGRGPTSDSMHLGHMVPFMFTKWLQDVFKIPLVIQISDDEKYYFKDIPFEKIYKLGFENAKDIIACGFDPKLTYIFSNRDYRRSTPEYETFVDDLKKLYSTRNVANIFGFDKGNKSSNVGQYDWPFYQSAAAFWKSFPHLFNSEAHCLVAYAIDQDPYFRMARDLAETTGLPKPHSIMSTFLPPLTGMSGKMSSSVSADSTIFLTDSEKTIRDKINKYAFSAGGTTLKEHREKGGEPEKDISYQYLRYFEMNDIKLNEIYDSFKSGKMTCSEIKKYMADKIVPIIMEHQRKRNEVTPEIVKQFYEKKFWIQN